MQKAYSEKARLQKPARTCSHNLTLTNMEDEAQVIQLLPGNEVQLYHSAGSSRMHNIIKKGSIFGILRDKYFMGSGAQSGCWPFIEYFLRAKFVLPPASGLILTFISHILGVLK